MKNAGIALELRDISNVRRRNDLGAFSGATASDGNASRPRKSITVESRLLFDRWIPLDDILPVIPPEIDALVSAEAWNWLRTEIRTKEWALSDSELRSARRDTIPLVLRLALKSTPHPEIAAFWTA